ncbi:hypothetical protein ABK040_008856 [Willaertia magna]
MSTSSSLKCLLKPDLLEFTIVIDPNTLNTNNMDTSIDSTDQELNENYNQIMTIINPYDFPLNFNIACSKIEHYSIKTSKGTIQSTSELKVKLKLKSSFINQMKNQIINNNNINVEQTEYFDDFFQIRLLSSSSTNSLGTKIDEKLIIKSRIKIITKAMISTPTIHNTPIIQQFNEVKEKKNIRSDITEEDEEAKNKFKLVEDHFSPFTTTTAKIVKNNSPNIKDSTITTSTINNNNATTTTNNTNNNEKKEENVKSPSRVIAEITNEKINNSDISDNSSSTISYDKLNTTEEKKSTNTVKSILRKQKSKKQEINSISDLFVQNFPILAGLTIVFLATLFNGPINWDTTSLIVAAFLVGCAAMYVQIRLNQ